MNEKKAKDPAKRIEASGQDEDSADGIEVSEKDEDPSEVSEASKVQHVFHFTQPSRHRFKLHCLLMQVQQNYFF